MNRFFLRIASSTMLAFLAITGCSDTPPPEVGVEQPQLSPALAFRDGDPSIRISNLADGDVVTSPVRVEVVTNGVTLAPAGSTTDGYGHWHLLIDRGCHGPGQQIPEGAESLLVGTGDDYLTFDLGVGRHELCAQIGDGFHVAVDITNTVVIEVVN